MNSCKTCRWAEWQRTPIGNIKRHSAGRCIYPKIELPKIPECTQIIEEVMNLRNAIWPEDGTTCQCYERIEVSQ